MGPVSLLTALGTGLAQELQGARVGAEGSLSPVRAVPGCPLLVKVVSLSQLPVDTLQAAVWCDFLLGHRIDLPHEKETPREAAASPIWAPE